MILNHHADIGALKHQECVFGTYDDTSILNHHADIGALKHLSIAIVAMTFLILNHHADIGALKHHIASGAKHILQHFKPSCRHRSIETIDSHLITAWVKIILNHHADIGALKPGSLPVRHLQA